MNETKTNEQQTDRNVFNIRQAANYLGISAAKIHSLKKNAAIPFTRIGKSIRFVRTDLDNWLSFNTTQPNSN